jgi:hypothetical protein
MPLKVGDQVYYVDRRERIWAGEIILAAPDGNVRIKWGKNDFSSSYYIGEDQLLSELVVQCTTVR